MHLSNDHNYIQSPRSWLSFGRSFTSSPPPNRSVSLDLTAARVDGNAQGSAKSTPGLSAFKSLGSPGSPGGMMGGVEKDTDNLFCSHTVEEIKKIEQQTRLDIDRRKEDLRQMVG